MKFRPQHGASALRLDRRRFVQGMALAGGAGSLGFVPGRAAAAASPSTLVGPEFDLTVAETHVDVTGRMRMGMTVNGLWPSPTLYWREGETVTVRVANRLDEPTSIHWHGVRVPAAMDGVPGLSFRGIGPGETFTYRFPVVQNGTYWYHSHSGMQEQMGMYGALVVLPKDADPNAYDREHVVVLTDWTDADPMSIVANLKQDGEYYNYGQRTVGDLARELKRDGVAATWRERSMWGRMRMTPTDILDVSGAAYTYLVNGASPRANWTGLYAPGERVRLRVINAASMTLFDVRIPGLKLEVVQADGCDVHPVRVDQFRIGPAETYDVIVRPEEERAYTLFAQAQDRSGYARATLAPRMGMSAPVPPMDPRPVRSMSDMGMSMQMGDMSGPMGDMSGMDMSKTPDMDMSGMKTPPSRPKSPPLPGADASGVDPVRMGVNVDNLAAQTSDRQGEAGDGLDHDGRRTLVYTDLKALARPPDPRPPTREVVFHLTGNMQRWTWGFDGKKFAEAPPVRLKLGERLRFVLINDTMMEHPIHLHGLFSELENGQADFRPLKHTVLVKPGERISYLVSADTPGHWAFHCHLMYHMETGMFRTVVVA
ncbi:MAG: copper resistance system multicopper oxidase [Caulobacteraceae bacterium]